MNALDYANEAAARGETLQVVTVDQPYDEAEQELVRQIHLEQLRHQECMQPLLRRLTAMRALKLPRMFVVASKRGVPE